MNTARAVARRTEFAFAERALRALRSLADRLAIAHRTPALRHRIDKGATAWIDRPAGRTVTCEAGTLWLTFDGEPDDVILEVGQTHCCTHRSRLAVHALDAAAMRLA